MGWYGEDEYFKCVKIYVTIGAQLIDNVRNSKKSVNWNSENCNSDTCAQNKPCSDSPHS